MIGRSRNRLRQPSTVSHGLRRRRVPTAPLMRALLRSCDQAADHDHADEDHALRDGREVGVDVEEGHVGADQLEDDDGHDRADDAAPAAGEAHAAQHDRGDAQQRVRARDRRPDAGAGGEREAAERGEQARVTA